jgi:GGDEF domain-containing protein
VVEAAEQHIRHSEDIPVETAELRLSSAADHLVASLEAGHRRVTRLRGELVASISRAEEDQLTGLGNRHFLQRFLGDTDRAADLLVLLADVDGLKFVNDTYGHEAGDALLSTVAATLREHSRPTDVVVRWGGDEFIVLVPDAGVMAGSAALAVGERLAEAVRACPPPRSVGSPSPRPCRSACAPVKRTGPAHRRARPCAAAAQAGHQGPRRTDPGAWLA